MSVVKHINVNDGSNRKFEDNTVGEIALDTKPELGSFNLVTSDAVARAVAGASGEVPQVTEDDNGKVLKAVYDEGGAAVEWGEAGGSVTVDQSYDPTSENAQSGTAVAEAIAGHTCTAGNGITISGNGVVSVNGGDGLRITYDAVQSGIQVGDAFKYHVGDISAATADIGFSISISAPQFNKFFSPDSSISSTHLVVVAANPSDTSIYAIGPVCYDFDWELASGVEGAMVDTEGSDITVSSSVFSAFGRDAFLSTIDSNGDVLLYLCATTDGTALLGSGNGPGGSACASMMWGPYDNTRPYFSITLGEELAGPGRLDVANPVPSYNTAEDGKVLGVVDNSGSAELQWVSVGGGSDQPLPAVATNTLRFEFEDMSFDPTNDTGCNFTGTSWAKVTESVTRNIWDCTLASSPSSGGHFAITEPCKVIDGNLDGVPLSYAFGGSTGSAGLTSVTVTVGPANCSYAFSNCTSLEYVEIRARDTYAFQEGNNAQYMFSGCTALRRVKFVKQPNNYRFFMLNNAAGCFSDCHLLEAIEGDVAFGKSRFEGGLINGNLMFAHCYSLKSVDNLFTREWSGIALSNGASMFAHCHSLKSIGFPISISGGSCTEMFSGCLHLEHVALIDFEDGNRSMQSMFEDCYSLQSVNLVRTGNVQNMSQAFKMDDRAPGYYQKNSLLKLPVFPTDSATDVSNMFAYNIYADGALAMYQQMSQQANPPTTTTGCFTNCGSITHASDLAQIPASWGGTGA